MDISKEGYIKFKCHLTEGEYEFPDEIFSSLEKWRHRLYELELIGAYDDGIGFGNISHRLPGTGRFIISGSATGNLERLEKRHYALVTDCDFAGNSLHCTGMTKASSESLSHAAVYESVPSVSGVIHIHSKILWDKLKFELPTTLETIPYGTPEMAAEIQRVIVEFDLNEQGIIVMAGHEEGIISFSHNLDQAGMMILEQMNR